MEFVSSRDTSCKWQVNDVPATMRAATPRVGASSKCATATTRRLRGTRALRDSREVAGRDRARVADFLAAREKRFERDLARYGGVGFHCGRPIRFALFPEMQPAVLNADDRKWQRRLEATDRKIDQLQYEQMVLLGRSDAQVEVHYRQREQFRSRVIERQRGYVGWLLTNPAFRAERDAFFDRWKQGAAAVRWKETAYHFVLTNYPAKRRRRGRGIFGRTGSSSSGNGALRP